MEELPSATVNLSDASVGDGRLVSVSTADGTSASIALKRGGEGVGVDVLDMFVVTGLVKSKGEARRLLLQGGLYVNSDKWSPERPELSAGAAIHGAYYVLRKGGRDIAIVRLVS